MATQVEVFQYHGTDGVRHVLVSEGRVHLRVVTLDGIVRVKKLPKSERRFMAPAGERVTLTKAKRSYRRRGKVFGITKEAKRLCKVSA